MAYFVSFCAILLLHRCNYRPMASLPARAIENQVISCDWYRRQTVAISADSDVNGSFVIEYMGFRSEQVRIDQSCA